jgi:hypothetical protein
MWIIGNLKRVDEHGVRLTSYKSPEITFERLIRNPDIVRQQPTFFRRCLIELAGGWNPDFFMAMDLDLWVRLAKVNVPKMVDKTYAFYRLHSQQKSSLDNLQRQTLEICNILKREGISRDIIVRLYLKKQWYAIKAYCKIS